MDSICGSKLLLILDKIYQYFRNSVYLTWNFAPGFIQLVFSVKITVSAIFESTIIISVFWRLKCMDGWQPPKVFVKIKCVLKNFAKFTGEHLCQSLFFNKDAGAACYFIKKQTVTKVFSCKFFLKEHLFYRTPLGDCFYKYELKKKKS